MCLAQCCPWLLGVGMMVAGQAGRTLRTLTASSLSVPDLQSAQPGTLNTRTSTGVSMYMYVHSKGAEGLKKGSYEEDIVREGVSS